MDDAVTQRPLAAEQPRAGLDIHDDGFIDGRDLGRELQGPGGNAGKLIG
jgi:hypothetical protein